MKFYRKHKRLLSHDVSEAEQNVLCSNCNKLSNVIIIRSYGVFCNYCYKEGAKNDIKTT